MFKNFLFIGSIGGRLVTEYKKFNIVLRQEQYIKYLKRTRTINGIVWIIFGFVLWFSFLYFYSIYHLDKLSFHETCDIMGGKVENNICLVPNWL